MKNYGIKENGLTNNKVLLDWVEEVAQLTRPEKVVWITGDEAQLEELRAEGCETGELHKLNEEKLPGCYLHNSDVNDVARVEGRTFICCEKEENAGPTNNWMNPKEMYAKLNKLYDGCMEGRTMYVIPFSMGVVGSPFAKYGIEITDSIYVVVSMNIMTRIGTQVLEAIGENGEFTKGLHAKADLDPEERYIVHFPEDNTIMSINSGYGGNVLLGKKCLALRIASYLGKNQGWMAEHMLILGVKNPQGEQHYVAAAFPSACGKTNLAMLIPPEGYKKEGWEVTCVGDDIAWIRVGEDGRLWATNPENGFFGVAPGTNAKSNPNALAATMKNTIFTNVALNLDDNTVWWEKLDKNPPTNALDWTGVKYDAEAGGHLAHPNSRFTAPAINCPCISPAFEDAAGVPLSAIVFGGRRAKTAPLVYQSRDWEHGVFVGSIMASETTAAASGAVGVVRRDPMAMLPFCGYNMGDYWQHWLDMGKKITNPPKIFNVNWFRTDEEGNFVWPGFGDNLRVLEWILKRADEKIDANETEIGFIPNASDINIEDCDIDMETLESILKVETEYWLEDIKGIKEFYAKFGDKLPKELADEVEAMEARLTK
ncbi:MAG: phosphoenolpyruvate carboxykinase (GTP) [Eubacterium sp.]|nr:phosphoenolpyruvate carboxykinase (GTP) [Eubacterium sp.]